MSVTAAQLVRFSATAPDLVDHMHQMRAAMAYHADNWACNQRTHTTSQPVRVNGHCVFHTVWLFTEGLN